MIFILKYACQSCFKQQQQKKGRKDLDLLLILVINQSKWRVFRFWTKEAIWWHHFGLCESVMCVVNIVWHFTDTLTGDKDDFLEPYMSGLSWPAALSCDSQMSDFDIWYLVQYHRKSDTTWRAFNFKLLSKDVYCAWESRHLMNLLLEVVGLCGLCSGAWVNSLSGRRAEKKRSLLWCMDTAKK